MKNDKNSTRKSRADKKVWMRILVLALVAIIIIGIIILPFL